MAENKYGVSDPATTAQPIRAKHPFGKNQKLFAWISKTIPFDIFNFFPVFFPLQIPQGLQELHEEWKQPKTALLLHGPNQDTTEDLPLPATSLKNVLYPTISG